MDRFAIVVDGTPIEIPFGQAFTLGEIRYPPGHLAACSQAELAELNAYVIVEASAAPRGSPATGSALALYNGQVIESLVLEDISTAEFAGQLQDLVRARRWQQEVAGTAFGDIALRTDEESQGKVNGLISLFDRDPEMTSSDFEAQPGVWVSLTQDQAIAAGVAIGRHVQACFTRSRQLSEAITAAVEADDRAALLAIDIESGWPT